MRTIVARIERGVPQTAQVAVFSDNLCSVRSRFKLSSVQIWPTLSEGLAAGTASEQYASVSAT